WLKLSKKWLQDEYGEGFVYAVLHTDERTPHIHAVCVPLYQSKTKHREAWKVSHKQHPATKGKGSYERLRRRCADALGFEYGDPGNKPRTEAQRLADEAAVARAAGLLSAARATAQGIVSRAKGLLAETEGRVARISKDLDHAAKMADLVGMEARAQAARQQKAKITPHTAAVRAMQQRRGNGER
ncbi:plasmid recombination protein, partial [Sulfitobacter geojensis]